MTVTEICVGCGAASTGLTPTGHGVCNDCAIGEPDQELTAEDAAWLARGGDLESGPADGHGVEPRVVPPPTDPMAVARQFAADHFTDRKTLLLRHHRDAFYEYSGSHWAEVDPADIRNGLYEWLETAVFEKTTAKGTRLVAWEPNTVTVNRVLDALGVGVCHLDGATEAPAWVDGDGPNPAGELLSVGNGLLHLPTRTLIPHTPDLWSHQSLPFDYDPDAREPKQWLEFLADLWDDDVESIDTLGEIFGYLLSPDTSQQKIFLIVGPKRAGKGTIEKVASGLLGRDNVTAPTVSGFASNFGLSPLIGKPLAVLADARFATTGSSTIVERLLSISGEDPITLDRKYRDPWTGRLPTRFLILTNEPPRLADASGALASRFIVLTLTRSFYGREDFGLKDKLLAELPGILNWALDGLDRLQARGHFVQPKASRSLLEQIEDLGSPVSAFIRDRCIVGPAFSVSVDAIYKEYQAWCESQGTKHISDIRVFGKDLTAAEPGISKSRPRVEGGRSYWYQGIGLRDVTAVEPALEDELGATVVNDEPTPEQIAGL